MSSFIIVLNNACKSRDNQGYIKLKKIKTKLKRRGGKMNTLKENGA